MSRPVPVEWNLTDNVMRDQQGDQVDIELVDFDKLPVSKCVFYRGELKRVMNMHMHGRCVRFELADISKTKQSELLQLGIKTVS